MSYKNIQATGYWILSIIIQCTGQIILIFLLLLSNEISAQEETKPRNFSIHAGINGGILSGGTGPSFSFHYAFRTKKVLQTESMLFFDSHSGDTFLSGYAQKNLGAGLVTGIRINVLPKKNWNPSFVLMGGVMYSSEITSQPRERKGFSGALSLGISNAFYKKHMVSLGYNAGRNIASLHLKYGFYF